MITIHFNDTTLDVQESDDSYRYRSLMGDHNLTLKFSLPEYVEIPVGAWCEYMAIRYTLAAPANIKKNGTRDIEYTLIMESAQYQLNRYKLRNTVDKRLKFSMCATPKEYIQVIVDNLNQRDSGWAVGDCIVSTEKTIAFDHSFVSDALQSVADTFNSEWEIVGKTIHLKKVEYFKDDPLPLSYGKGNGFVPGVGRTTETGSRPVEILFVQGGSQNIDRSKYGSAELLLPKSQTLEYEGRTYISDADGYSIRRQDKAVLYNNEDSLDCSEIYPSRVGKVTKVEVIDEANNFYDIIDNTIPENLNYNDYLIEGENMTIIFQSGMLAGDDKAFELKYNHAERRFEIVPQEIDGLTMPGGVYIPHEGDTYAIFGCMLPDAYICDNATKTGASWDMFREAARYLYENEDTKFTFSGELQGMWAKRNWLKVGGKLVVGGYVLFTDNQFAPDGVKIRITGIKDYLTSPYAPTVELSNSVSGKSLNSTLNELENGNVIVDENQKKIIQFTKRRFRDSLETIDMLEQALLENFTNSINPIAVQTMAMLVGDESLQFRFVDSSLNPIQYHITYNQETKQLIAPATVLQHMTLGIDTITSSRDKNTYKHWTMSGYTSPVLDQISQKYYFYAKVPTGTGTGEFVLSPTAIGMNDVSGYYHLLVGVLNSEYDGERSFVTLYGFSEILPGRITTDRIISPDGTTYFDLANGEIGGNIKIKAGSSGLHNLEEWDVLNTQITDIEKSIDETNDVITDLGDYVDGAFADGIISEAEAQAIEKYLNTVNNTKASVEATYNKLYANNYLTGAAKTDLLNAKVTLFGAINNLIASINTAISDGKATSAEKQNVDNKFVAFNTALASFNTAVEAANKAIQDELKSYSDECFAELDVLNTQITDIEKSIDETNDVITDLGDYVDGAFADGIISEAEAQAIEKYLNTVNNTKASVEATYNKLYANNYLTGAAKTDLLNAKVTLFGAINNLIASINTAISDGKATSAEKQNVDNKFVAFNTALASFNTAVEAANKAIQDELKSYSDECFAELDVLNTQITAQVTRIDSLTNRIDTAGWITTADGNKLYASKSLENGDTLISYINQAAGSTTIHSNKINLEGAVSFSSLTNSLQGTINEKVNSSSLGSLAYKNQVAEDLLSADLSSLINGKVDSSDIGALAYKDAVEAAQLGSTIIVGGYLNTDYIKVNRIDANGARVGGFTIDNGRLYWKSKDYFGSDSRSLKLGVSTSDTDGVVDISFNAATQGRFGVKACGANLGGAAIYASRNSSGQTYPNMNNTYAGYFDGGVHVNGNVYCGVLLANEIGVNWSIDNNGTYTYTKGIDKTLEFVGGLKCVFRKGILVQ